MDSTLELLNYSPKIVIHGGMEEEDPSIFFSSEKEEQEEESGFQEEESHVQVPSSTSWSSYPGPEAPFDSWFSSESDMLILYELLGEFYDEEFEKMSYKKKKALKDKVKISVPKSPEELLKLFPEEHSLLSQQGEASFSMNNNPSEMSVSPSKPRLEESHKDFSQWFEPLEELVLFDILGIDYREIFEGMTLREKRKIRSKVDSTEPKSREEILALLDNEEEEEEAVDSLPSPKMKKSGRKEKSRRLTLLAQSPVHSCRGARSALSVPSYQRPTSASALREHIPRSTEKLTCPRHHEPSPSGFFSPQQFHSRRLHTGIDLSKVVSPVAQYIHSRPAPPLIRNVRSRTPAKRFFTEETCKENLPPSREEHYPSLPEANYKSSPLLTEQEIESPQKSSSSSNTPTGHSVEPKIFRHLGRVKVPKSLQLNEGVSEDLEKLISSPSSPCKMTLRRNHARRSVEASPNDSMIDMSVHEVKAIQKLNHLNI